MTLGFKSRIILGVGLLVTLSLVVLGSLNAMSLRDNMVSALVKQTQNKVDHHVLELEQLVQSQLNAVEKGAGHFARNLTESENVAQVRMLADTAGIANVIMTYESGRSYMSNHSSDGITTNEYDFRDRDWYRAVKSSQDIHLSEIYTDKVTGEKVISAVAPVFENGRFIGALLGDIPLQNVITQVSQMRFAGGAATLTDQNAVFFASDDPNDIGKTPSQVSANFSEMESMFRSNEKGHLTFPYSGIQFDGYFQRVNLTEGRYWTLMVFVDQKTALAEVTDAQIESVGTGILLLIVSLGAIYGIIQVSYRPLLKLKEAVLDLSRGEGDLTTRLDVNGNDDLAQISDGFNRFVENLQNMMLSVAESSQAISANISQLSQTTSENEAVLDAHSAETEQVVTAITQMSESARSIAENVSQSNNITAAASKEANQSLKVVDNAVVTVSALVDEVEEMSGRITSMNTDANRISDVLTVIGDISEQTNLLALNAAIEAARAGEQGRGFAVVADEVRALAARTQSSTTEISDMLTALLDGTSSVVEAMEKTKEQCQTTADKTSEVSNSLTIMSASVTEIDDVSTQIATATEQQSSVAEELSKNMLSIRDMVSKLVDSGNQTSAATKSLTHSNEELDRMVNNFKLR
ncbi:MULTISPECIES: methyl-accepting chemotaxis protein [unclassified Salinivibrio]|uniref:methyl-accepting chemotaxis protein n=2 Tax=Salinivibrio TaxID=51366 RepID=UPI0009877196|nr:MULTISPECIES: methyl-accepting chemotaxis protein [unclassified Salinivibrio]OOE91574.1 methyl-accepting chemotaxis protein [Salinivibrio sp. AR640]OOF06813.1 methyl-accepting chemotaxis protein [Salinivibrio sp. MA440]